MSNTTDETSPPLSQRELADALRIHESVVSRLAKRGMPTTSVEAARAWRADNLNPAHGRRKPDGASKDSADVGSKDETFAEARRRREVIEADLAELRLGAERGELVRVDDVRARLAKHVIAFRECLLQIPHRLAAHLAAEADQATVHALLDVEIRTALEHMVAADL